MYVKVKINNLPMSKREKSIFNNEVKRTKRKEKYLKYHLITNDVTIELCLVQESFKERK